MTASPVPRETFFGQAARPGDTLFQWSLEQVGPFNLGPNDVLLEVAYCGICGSDISKLMSPPVARGSVKVTPGHEITGKVVALGSAVQRVGIGDRVCVSSFIACYMCSACKMGRTTLCKEPKGIGINVDGGFVDYLVVPDTTVYRIPTSFSWELAALIEPLAATIHSLTRVQLGAWDRLVIVGAGSMGLLSAFVARKLFGVQKLIVVAKYGHQANFAERLGADGVIRFEPGMQNLAPEVRYLTDGEMATVIVEAAGGADVAHVDSELHGLSRGGRLVIVGRLIYPRQVDLHLLMKRELSIIGSFRANYQAADEVSHSPGADDDFAKAVDFCLRLDECSLTSLTSIVTHKFPLKRIRDAFKSALHKSASGSIKVQVRAIGARES